MELKDILTFAKAGYTYSQVKELLGIQTPAPTPTEQQIQIAEHEEKFQEPKEIIQEPKEIIQEIEEPKTETVIKETEKQIDYKALYEESQKKLKEAQSLNIQTNIEPLKENDEEIVIGMISNFL